MSDDIIKQLETMWLAQEPKLLWGDMQAVTDLAAFEIERLRAENEKLREQYNAGVAAWNPVYEIVLNERDTLKAENEKLRAATGSLVRSLSGCWYAFEPSLRREMGNTNYHCVKEKMDEVEALLNFRAARAAYLGEKDD